jgi:hypothetical protein
LFFAENRPVVELAHDAHARLFVADGAARMELSLDEAGDGDTADST